MSRSQFISSFPAPRSDPPNTPKAAQGSGQNTTPQGPVHTPQTAGSAALQDVLSGKELNLDGSVKAPYRHPHFDQTRQVPQQEQRQNQVAQAPPLQVINLNQPAQGDPDQHNDRRAKGNKWITEGSMP